MSKLLREIGRLGGIAKEMTDYMIKAKMELDSTYTEPTIDGRRIVLNFKKPPCEHYFSTKGAFPGMYYECELCGYIEKVI